MNKLTIPILSLMLLGACATAPLPSNHYEKVAMQFVGTHKCGAAGLMSVEMAAKGKEITRRYINSHTYDKPLLEDHMNVVNNTLTVTSEICNSLAMEIARISGSSAASVSPAYTPRTTNCSTYFGQTHCLTF